MQAMEKVKTRMVRSLKIMNGLRFIFILSALITPALRLFAGSETQTSDAFRADFEIASKALREVMPVCETMMVSGDVDGANNKLLAVFPDSNRTPAQSFLLGNLLFEIDRKKSYLLHQSCAKAEQKNSAVLFEWAMEQHRAGEYANALESYRKFSKAKPEDASSYALQADCLLHLNQIDEAVESWRKSEETPDGSVERMEEFVCAVKREPMPHQRRADLLSKAIKNQDTNAACDLIALDCDFPRDWWNGGPYKSYLTHDLAALKTAFKLAEENSLYRILACAADCAMSDKEDLAEIKKIFANHEMRLDDPHSVPSHGGILAVILSAAVESKAIDEPTLHEKIAPLILTAARKGKDARLWNAALFAAPEAKPEEQIKLQREAWQITGEARFAVGVLRIKQAGGQLSGNDPDLVAALKQFPESGIVQRVAIELAQKENKVTKQLLADAAKAEFTHFSSFVAFATIVDRPRSDYLRAYFAGLEKMAAKPKADEH